MRRLLSTTLAAALLAGASCGGGFGGAAEFHRSLEREGLALPTSVRLDEFRATCARISVTDPDALLEELAVPVRGRGDGRHLVVADLLGACGPECDPGEGLGELIRRFAVPKQNAR